MITLAKYLDTAKRLANQTTEYRIRGDCRNGKGDCVGLDIGILRECGINYKGLHSSNEFPRKYATGLRQIRKASDLEPGMIVWKAKEPGDSGYDLPKRYQGGADLKDYYHQGIVLSVNPLDIVHITTQNGVGGSYHDKKLGRWNWAGYNKYVDYGSNQKIDVEVLNMVAVVDSANDSGVNLRAKPSTKAKLVDQLPEGAVVTIISQDDSWAYVQYGMKSGYVMRQYLQIDINPDGGGSVSPGRISLSLDMQTATALQTALNDAISNAGGSSK